MEIQELKLAIGHVVSEHASGTSFLIGRRYALTCAHVVASATAHAFDLSKTVDLRFGASSSRKCVKAQVVAIDRELDSAVLLLESPAPNEIPIPDIGVDPGHDEGWQCFAYPDLAKRDGMTLSGTVADPKTTASGTPAIQLSCEQGGDSVRGASGGPVFVDGAVVGMLCVQLGQTRHDLETTYGAKTLYARPLTSLIASPAIGGYFLSPGRDTSSSLSTPPSTSFAPYVVSMFMATWLCALTALRASDWRSRGLPVHLIASAVAASLAAATTWCLLEAKRPLARKVGISFVVATASGCSLICMSILWELMS